MGIWAFACPWNVACLVAVNATDSGDLKQSMSFCSKHHCPNDHMCTARILEFRRIEGISRQELRRMTHQQPESTLAHWTCWGWRWSTRWRRWLQKVPWHWQHHWLHEQMTSRRQSRPAQTRTFFDKSDADEPSKDSPLPFNSQATSCICSGKQQEMQTTPLKVVLQNDGALHVWLHCLASLAMYCMYLYPAAACMLIIIFAAAQTQ